MRLLTYQSENGPRAGVLKAGSKDLSQIIDLQENEINLPCSIKAILEQGNESLRLAEKVAREGQVLKKPIEKVLPPVIAPQKIICVGLNYADHAAETGGNVGDEPIIFCKFPSTLCGHKDSIHLPPESDQVDYEAELVIVMGKSACRISPENAMQHIAGYCCGNDVSARDWQKGKPGKQWLLGKSFDSFAPLGPMLVTADEVSDPGNLSIQMKLNGKVMQNSNTSQLIFPIDYLVSYISHVCTLIPGDLIFTGTPPGVGVARVPPIFLQSGDTVEITIEGIGTLKNSVMSIPQR